MTLLLALLAWTLAACALAPMVGRIIAHADALQHSSERISDGAGEVEGLIHIKGDTL